MITEILIISTVAELKGGVNSTRGDLLPLCA